VTTKTPPSKNTDKDNTTPVVRRQTIILRGNPAILDPRLIDDNDEDTGRVLAFDTVTTFTPVLTSSRKKTTPDEKTLDETADALLTKGIAGLSIGGTAVFSTPQKKNTCHTGKKTVTIVPEKITSAVNQVNKKKTPNDDDAAADDDDEWIAPTDSEDHDSVSSTTGSDFIDSDVDDELDWSLRERGDGFRWKDLYSPERATGSFHYTVLSPDKGVPVIVRRSSRTSIGSPHVIGNMMNKE